MIVGLPLTAASAKVVEVERKPTELVAGQHRKSPRVVDTDVADKTAADHAAEQAAVAHRPVEHKSVEHMAAPPAAAHSHIEAAAAVEGTADKR